MLMDKTGATKEGRPHGYLGHSSRGGRDLSVPARGSSPEVWWEKPQAYGIGTGEGVPYPPCHTCVGSAWESLGQQWPWGRAMQRPRGRTHSPPASVRLLGVPTAGVAIGTVLGEEAPGSVGHIGGAPGAAPSLAGLLGRPGLRVAVDALLHGHGAGALRILLRAPAPAQGCRERPPERQRTALKTPHSTANFSHSWFWMWFLPVLGLTPIILWTEMMAEQLCAHNRATATTTFFYKPRQWVCLIQHSELPALSWSTTCLKYS